MVYYNDGQKATMTVSHTLENANTIQEGVDIFNDHAIHIGTKTHEELLELVNEHL